MIDSITVSDIVGPLLVAGIIFMGYLRYVRWFHTSARSKRALKQINEDHYTKWGYRNE